jgi:GAF domain-containing protein
MAARNLRQRIEELTVVADIASAMLSPLELSQVLEVALQQSSRALAAPFGSITLLSPDKARLEFAAVYGLSAGYGEKFRELGLLPADTSSPSGRGVSTGKPFWVADIDRHPLCASWKHISMGEGVRAFVSRSLNVYSTQKSRHKEIGVLPSPALSRNCYVQRGWNQGNRVF